MDKEYPDNTDILARKARGRRERALLSFDEKLDVLDRLRDDVAPIIAARNLSAEARRAKAEARAQGHGTD